MNRKDGRGGGIGFCSLLCVAFIVLKLCKVIDWSWIWILSPLWIPIAIVLVLAIISAALSELSLISMMYLQLF